MKWQYLVLAPLALLYAVWLLIRFYLRQLTRLWRINDKMGNRRGSDKIGSLHDGGTRGVADATLSVVEGMGKIINKEIKMGRILCWFGIHKWGTYTKGYGNFATILYGVCGRCWKRK